MKKRFTEEQIIGFLREAEAGLAVAELCRRCRFTLSLSVLHLNLSVPPTAGIPFLMRFNESNH